MSIECPGCAFANPSEARFCAGCGVALPERCATCAGTLIAEAAFCHLCGARRGASATPPRTDAPRATPPASGRPPAPSSPPAPPPARAAEQQGSVAELRQVTVLFADIVDSTGLAQRLDLEDYRALLASFRKVAQRIAPEFNGHVAQFAGDGALILFGYPVALEDAAARAIWCGMELARAAREIGSALSGSREAGAADEGLRVELRVSINTGSVVVDQTRSADGKLERDIFGDVPNVAERLKQIAQPGEVVVSAATQRLTSRRFRFHDMGEKELKGVEGLVRAFRVDGAARDGTGRDLRDRAIVGRGGELSLLAQRWASAVEGDGQVVLLSGEAGIGKSSILQILRDRIGAQPHRVLTLGGASIRSGSPFHVLGDAFERLIGVDEGEDQEARRTRIAEFLSREGLDPALFADGLALLFGINADEACSVKAEAARRMLRGTLVDLLVRLGRTAPLLILAEDLHWIDPSSLEFLAEIAAATDGRNWLLIATYRPDFEPSWPARPNVTALTLGRLSRRDTLRLIELVAGKPLPGEVVEQIADRTDGVPLFVEELTKMVVESGLMRDEGDRFALKGPLPPLSIPASLQDSLMARLDRLASVKDVAQIAAAIGRRFPSALLRHVSGRLQDSIDDALEQLTDAELIFQLRANPDAEFEFKHALVQDAAYQSLLRSARQKWHARIARAIEREFPHLAESEPEILGHHWTEAREFERGEECWTRAGRAALARSANLEAVRHFRAALGCLSEQPPGETRDRRELDLLIGLAAPLSTLRGYADQQVRETYARAESLSAALDDDSQRFPIVYGLFRSWMIGGDQRSALETAHRLDEIARRTGEPVHIAAARRSVGSALFYAGRAAEALPYLEALEASALDAGRRRAALAYDVVDLSVAAPAYSAWARWMIGRADAARADAGLAVERADATGHLFSRALARAFASWTMDFCGDRAASRRLAEEVLTLSRESGFSFWIGWAQVMAAAARGPEGLVSLSDGLERWRATGSGLGRPYFLWLKARSLIEAGHLDAAGAALDAAQTHLERSGEGWWRPEVLRLRAHLHPNDPDIAERHLRDALAAAEAMGADALALRASADLARLTLEQDGADEKAALGALLERVVKGGETADTAFARDVMRAIPPPRASGRAG